MDKDLTFSDLTRLNADLNKISSTVKEKWKEIGHMLGLSDEFLCTIHKDKKVSSRCFYAMLNAWLLRKGVDSNTPSTFGSVTLRALVHVLESTEVGESKAAAKLVELRGKEPSSNKKILQTTQVIEATPVKKPRKATPLPKPELEDYLRAYYLRGSRHQKDEWPPSFNVEYINLILIQHSLLPWQQSKAKDNIGLITKGHIEKVKGQKLALESIMASRKRVCLINGAPGVGKTRLAMKLRRDWAAGELFKDYHLVLYIPLREPIARLSENVDDLLKYFGKNCNEGDRDLIKKQHGKGILFILDGWDELRLSCRGDAQFFPRLIRGIFLPGCNIIVTSRPGASQDIHHHADQVIEILGFGRSEVEEYIQAYFNKENGASKLVNDLKRYPNIANTCYVAINLAIVCHVYHARDYMLPETLTEVYKWFIIHTVLRYLRKRLVAEEIDLKLPLLNSTNDFFYSNHFDETIKNIFKDSELIKDTLWKLGKLAVSGLQNDDLCFSRKDLVSVCNLDTCDYQFDGFGLLKPVQISHAAESEPYYHFLHLSIQEFIAAFYVSQIEEKEQCKWLRDHETYRDMIKFFCGIVQCKSRSLDIFLGSAKPIRLFHLECVYEGQDKQRCKAIAEQCSNTFTLCGLTQYGSTLHHHHWEVLGYVMSNSGTKWSFKCNKLFLEEDKLACFNRYLANNSTLDHFSFEQVCFKGDAVIQLSTICKLQVGLTKLEIINCIINDEDLWTILRAIEKHPSLGNLCIEDNSVTSQVLDAFLQLLPSLPVIKIVKLNVKSFSDRDYLAIERCCTSMCVLSPKLFTPKDFLVCGSIADLQVQSHISSKSTSLSDIPSVHGMSELPETPPKPTLPLHCEFLSSLKDSGGIPTLCVEEGGDGFAKFRVPNSPQAEIGQHILEREDGIIIKPEFMFIDEFQVYFKEVKKENTGIYLVKSKYTIGESVGKIYLNVLCPPKYKPLDEVVINSGNSVFVEFELESDPPVDKYAVHTLTSNGKDMSDRFPIKDNTISFTNMRKEEAGLYTISCKNSNGTEGKATINLSVKDPPKYKLPDEVVIDSGNSVFVEFELDSDPPVDKYAVHNLTSNGKDMSDRFLIKDNTISFTNVRKEEAGLYTISCKNSNGTEGRATINLSVKDPPKYKLPDEVVIDSGNSACVEFELESDPPVNKYTVHTLTANGKDLSDRFPIKDHSIFFTKVRKEEAGLYTISCKNSNGTESRATINLSVKESKHSRISWWWCLVMAVVVVFVAYGLRGYGENLFKASFSQNNNKIEVLTPSYGTKLSMKNLENLRLKDGSSICVPEEIVDYTKFGNLLLEETTGNTVNGIVQQHQRNAGEINRDILRRWLNGEGKKPISWRTLVETIKDMGLILADQIENRA